MATLILIRSDKDDTAATIEKVAAAFKTMRQEDAADACARFLKDGLIDMHLDRLNQLKFLPWEDLCRFESFGRGGSFR